jgi:hypothetical protein
VTDAFTYGQEPDSRAPTALATNQRIPGDNIRNYGAITFSAQLTPVFGTEIGYANAYYDYQATFNPAFQIPGNPVVASPSGALDRLEHNIHVDARWNVRPTTVVLVGYMYQQIDYTGNEIIAGDVISPGVVANPLMSDQRNSSSHIGYAGVEHLFNPNLRGSLRLGAQYATFPNDPQNTTQLSPYGTGSLSYTYRPKSHMDIGFSLGQSATDITGTSSTNFVRNTDTITIFGSITHQIIPNLFGNAVLTFQNSTFNGGSVDGQNEQYYQIGLNLKYEFNHFLATEIGYNYDRTESDITARQYDRNRVYVDVSGSY